MNDENFFRLHFKGARFDGHEIPLDVLRDLSVLNDIILDIAVKKYMASNPKRQRLPRGFRNQNWLTLSRVEPGSVRVCIAVASLSAGLFSNYFTCIDEARDAVLDTLRNVETPGKFDPSVTQKSLSNLATLGQHLQEGEMIDFEVNDSAVSYDSKTCSAFRKAAQKVYEENVDLYGTICEYDKEKHCATLKTFSGKRIIFQMTPEFSSTVDKAFQGYPNTRVELEGVQELDSNGTSKDKLSVISLEILDPLDTSARLEEFRYLKPGWLDGYGASFDKKRLDWLDNFLESLVDELPRPPYLYPIEGENVSAEWDVGASKITLEFDLNNKTATYYAFDTSTDEDRENGFNLDSEGVKELVKLLKETIV